MEADEAYCRTPQRELLAVCEQLDIPLLDLFPAFQQSDERRLFQDPIHLNEHGHRVVAKYVEDWLRAERLLPAMRPL